jgi:acyl-CoA thioesterase II
MSDIAEVLAVFEPTPTGDGTFTATHLDEGHQVVFGGQLLAQSLIAAARTVPDKEVLSLHCVFARAGAFSEPLDIRAEVVRAGRAFTTVSVTTSQSRGPCTTATVLLHAPDADRIRHEADKPDVQGPEAWQARPVADFWEVRMVDDVDISTPELVGPPELPVWVRFPGSTTEDKALNQALVAYASDGFLIATAMRPHEGVGQSMAHVSVDTTVLAQTLTFHEPIRAGEWLLFDQRSTYAGRGRSHGTAEVFTEDGRLVASFVQDNMVREMPVRG